MSEFSKRLITGILIIVFIIALPLIGKDASNIAVLLLALIGLFEFYGIFQDKIINRFRSIALIFVILYYISSAYFPRYADIIITSFIIITLISMLFGNSLEIKSALVLLTGFFYVPYLLHFILLLPNHYYFWLVFIIAFGTDTFAYLGGRFFGKHKLCPSISPKKTVEGAVTGLLFSVILSCAYLYIMDSNMSITMVLMCSLASILSQMGDLVASTFKRYNDVKDYGRVFPGHGGVLDRFDSVIFVAPIVSIFVNL